MGAIVSIIKCFFPDTKANQNNQNLLEMYPLFNSDSDSDGSSICTYNSYETLSDSYSENELIDDATELID